MIVDLLLQPFIALLRGMLWLLPDLGVPDLGELGFGLGSTARLWDGYFPVRMLFLTLALLVALSIGLFVWRSAVFVWKLVPLT